MSHRERNPYEPKGNRITDRMVPNGQRAQRLTSEWAERLEVAAEIAKIRGIETMEEFLDFWSPKPDMDLATAPKPDQINYRTQTPDTGQREEKLKDRVLSRFNLRETA